VTYLVGEKGQLWEETMMGEGTGKETHGETGDKQGGGDVRLMRGIVKQLQALGEMARDKLQRLICLERE